MCVIRVCASVTIVFHPLPLLGRRFLLFPAGSHCRCGPGRVRLAPDLKSGGGLGRRRVQSQALATSVHSPSWPLLLTVASGGCISSRWKPCGCPIATSESFGIQGVASLKPRRASERGFCWKPVELGPYPRVATGAVSRERISRVTPAFSCLPFMMECTA